MCGRTACTLGPEEIIQACTYRDRKGKEKRPVWVDAPDGRQYKASCNLAPGSHTPVLVSAKRIQDLGIRCSKEDNKMGDYPQQVVNCDRVMMPMKWGLTPSWHQGDPYKIPYETNNCRSEGMLDKKTYKIPLQKGNRCVVLADGFYEWKTTKEGKQPYFFYFPQTDALNLNFKLGDKKIKSETVNDCKLERAGQVETKVKQELDDLTNSSGIVKKETNTDFCSHQSQKRKIENFDEPDGIKVQRLDVSTKPFGHKEQDVKEETGKEDTKEDNKPEEDWNGWKPLTMAAVFDVWKPNNGCEPLFSYSIITVSSSKDLEWCHHRMPAILTTDEEIENWLDSSTIPLNKAVTLVKPQQCLSFHPVSKAVNSSRYNSPDCTKPVELGQTKAKPNASSMLMMNWLKSSPVKKEKSEDVKKSK